MTQPIEPTLSAAPAPYGTGAILFHWLAFALVVFLGILGLLLEDFPRATQPFWINVHGTVGLVYFVVVLGRIAWRLSHRPPALPAGTETFSRVTSGPVHLLLYAIMLAIPVAGVIAFVWHGRAFDYALFKIDFGIASNRNIFHPAEDVHVWLAYSLFALAGIHACAALWHHFIQKDGILARMLPAHMR